MLAEFHPVQSPEQRAVVPSQERTLLTSDGAQIISIAAIEIKNVLF
jgi:hypothetical protein